MENTELRGSEDDRMLNSMPENTVDLAQINSEQQVTELSYDEYAALKARIYTRVYALVWLISLICAIPFLKYVSDDDYKSEFAEELLKSKHPRAYERYLIEKQADPEGREVEQEDFSTPITWISLFLGSYAIFSMLSVVLCFYQAVNLFLALPPLIKGLIVFIFYTFLYGFVFLGTCYLVEKIGKWVMGDKYRQA